MRIVVAVHLVLALAVSPASSAAAPVPRGLAGDSSGTLTGVLTGRDDGQPVPYGTVLVVETGEERFADASGAFRLSGIVPGTYTVRARQIGYAPRDTIIEIAAAPAVTSVSITLARLPILLNTVRVQGHRPDKCVSAGIPDSVADPALAGLFAQLEENVDRYRLLMQQYPFQFSREEQRYTRYDANRTPRDVRESVDTTTLDSGTRRPYRIGNILYHDTDARGIRRLYMYVPTFGELGDSAFLAAHCFRYGGTVSAAGSAGVDLLRLDFVPLASIKQPDVSGSVYLDAQRLIVRRAVFGLTNPDAVHPSVIAFKVTTVFRELVPLVPLMVSIETEQPLDGHAGPGFSPGQSPEPEDSAETKRQARDAESPTREAINRYRVLDVHFMQSPIGKLTSNSLPWPSTQPDTDSRSRGHPSAPASRPGSPPTSR
jgi:hypothetical protein